MDHSRADSERFFDDFPSSCHHPQLARRRASAALGRPAAAVSSLAGMVSCQTLRVVGEVVSVGLVARSTFSYVNLSSLARGLGRMYAHLRGRSLLACHVVFSMLLWLYMRCRSALFCNGAAPQCGWVGLIRKLCVAAGWRKKRASLIACLAPVFLCRIVLIRK